MTENEKHERRVGWQGWLTIGVLGAVLVGGGTFGVVSAQAAAAEAAHTKAVAAQEAQFRITIAKTGAAINDYADAINAEPAELEHAAAVKVEQEVAAKAAAEAAAKAAAQAAAQAAAEEAARQAAQQDAQQSAPPSDSGPVLCPAGTHALAVDANGNESNCDPLNSDGQPCQAYNAANQCTAWLQE